MSIPPASLLHPNPNFAAAPRPLYTPHYSSPYNGNNGNGMGGNGRSSSSSSGGSTALYILLPIIIVLSTLLVLILAFLVGVLVVKRRRGVRLVEDGGPLDLSKNDGVIGEGGVAGVESRWLEEVSEDVREGYRRGKEWQQQYPPSSVSTDITLSQFLSIQEKGVSAWCFEPDYESNPSLYVESRTEITFLADGPGMAPREGGGNTVVANLPIPKLNEVYYWEAKMYEKLPGTEVVVGLVTKPYPSFRMPGHGKVSCGYFSSDGFKCHNYQFTSSSYGPPLNEGDVIGVGYRPRTGTVFFTRNGRKMDDCYTGLAALNLFPAIGANGAATVHVNLGQAGFVFIEANVKKWGLAPMMGTLAPPPAYGSERGSILLDAGYGAPGARSITPDAMANTYHAARRLIDENSPQGSSTLGNMRRGVGQPIPSPPRAGFRQGHRRGHSQPIQPSPLRTGSLREQRSSLVPASRRLGRQENSAAGSGSGRYHSPTDRPELNRNFPSAAAIEGEDEQGGERDRLVSDSEETESVVSSSVEDGEMYDSSTAGLRRASSPGGSPLPHNPPTPNLLDISLHSIHHHSSSPNYFGGRAAAEEASASENSTSSSGDTVRPDDVERRERRRQRREERRAEQLNSSGQEGLQARLQALVQGVMGPGVSDVPPPGYAPLDPYRYAEGVPTDLPAEIISQAFEDPTARNTQQNAQPNRTGFWARLTGQQ